MALKDLLFFKKKIKKQLIPEKGWSFTARLHMPVRQLQIGMYVIELDRPWLETDFIFQGFEIKTEQEIQQLQAICEYVYIDTTILRNRSPKLHGKSTPAPKTTAGNSPPRQKETHFEDEIQRAKNSYYATGRLLSDILDRVARGDNIDAETAKQAVVECVNSILNSADATLWLSQLKDKDQYTAQHSLNVCVLSIILGRHLDLPPSNLINLGLCGLLHDVGKMRVPLNILNKPGKLEVEEMRIMRTHTSLGYELLKSCDGILVDAINTAIEHHERIDGKGYPNKVGGGGLSLYSKIVTIADMYDAITSDRVYQKSRTHLEATKVMYNLAGRHLDENLCIKFIESLGVYPPGSFVGFTNGAIGQVMESNVFNKLQPKIRLILDEQKNPAPEKKIDLALMPKDMLGKVYIIKKIIKARDYNINAAKYFQEGLLQKGCA